MSNYQPAQPTHLTKGSVQKLAESIAVQVGFEPGGSVHHIVEAAGGHVAVEDTLLTDPAQTGSLYVDGSKRFRIIVPSHTSPERDRFTIAHEFGHYVLHYLYQRQSNPDYPERVLAFRRGSDRIEWEANWFAAAFLMPAQSFREKYHEASGHLSDVARQFRVSEKAASVRARDLGLA